MGLALHGFHDTYKYFPPAHSAPTYYASLPPPPAKDSNWFISWMARILPHIEQDNVHRLVNYKAWPWWQHPVNETSIKIYICPSDTRGEIILQYGPDKVALTDYLGVSGTDQLAFNGILHVNGRVKMTGISDGTSNTFLVGERPPSYTSEYGWWFAGSGDAPYFGATDVVLGVNEIKDPLGTKAVRDIWRPGSLNDPIDEHRWHYWSLHTGGGNFLLADGSVRFVTYSASQRSMNAASTRLGGEVNELP
ncbi:MAG: DUF1559 domain-containing protein [Gemmataceae bacterium]|nr:DUF1559 domain-containing protein [Gemmataceae bacterium]MCI0639971.1 DUF1559 domain-containing protein [Gemmataceae bacterium]MCI0741038.1 DUF1559 domain-containing protein [Gemmataceae bacterium]